MEQNMADHSKSAETDEERSRAYVYEAHDKTELLSELVSDFVKRFLTPRILAEWARRDGVRGLTAADFACRCCVSVADRLPLCTGARPACKFAARRPDWKLGCLRGRIEQDEGNRLNFALWFSPMEGLPPLLDMLFRHAAWRRRRLARNEAAPELIRDYRRSRIVEAVLWANIFHTRNVLWRARPICLEPWPTGKDMIAVIAERRLKAVILRGAECDTPERRAAAILMGWPTYGDPYENGETFDSPARLRAGADAKAVEDYWGSPSIPAAKR
jgi:hypothetical protein